MSRSINFNEVRRLAKAAAKNKKMKRTKQITPPTEKQKVFLARHTAMTTLHIDSLSRARAGFIISQIIDTFIQRKAEALYSKIKARKKVQEYDSDHSGAL